MADPRQCIRCNRHIVVKDLNIYGLEKLLFAAERQATPILHHTIGLVASAGVSTQDMSSHAPRCHLALLSFDCLRVEIKHSTNFLWASAFQGSTGASPLQGVVSGYKEDLESHVKRLYRLISSLSTPEK